MEGARDGAARIAHISALDGARGMAVAGVLLFHGDHLRGGYLGVDFFFTLSGFLITTLLLAESSRSGAVSLGNFWARRARRLLPALAVLMVGVAIYAQVLAKPGELSQIRGDAFATLFYFANWHEIFSHTSYFTLFLAPSPLNHTWSLAIEEQFYVIWPLLFVVLLTRFKRATPKAVLVTSLAMASISSGLMIALYNPAHTNRVYFGTDTRAAAILFGAALAAALAAYGPPTRRNDRIALEAVGLVGVAVLAVAWTGLDGQSADLYRGGFLVCGLAATAIIATAVHPDRMLVARALSFGPLCGLGLISYGLYLYHWPIDIALDAQRAHLHGWPLFGLQTAVALAAALVSYHYIEQPIRRGRVSAPQLRRLSPAIALGLAVALFVTTAGTGSSASASGSGAITGKSAQLELFAAHRARELASADEPRVMIAGDSVADLLAQTLQSMRTTPPVAVYNAGYAGCNSLPGVTENRSRRTDGSTVVEPTAPCDPAWELPALEAFDPDVVVWLTSSPADDLMQHGHWISTCGARYADEFRRELTRVVGVLGSHGAHVVLTTSAYPRFRNADNDAAADCQNRLRRQVASATGTKLVDLFSYVCPHGKCRTKQDGVFLRSDGIHYAGPGGRLIGAWLLKHLR